MLRLLCVAALSLLLLAVSASAAERASVAGIVVEVEPVQGPIAAARVTVVNISSGASSTTVADSDGRFLINDIPAGRYHITASKPTFVPKPLGNGGRPQTVVVGLAGDVEGVRVEMVRGGSIDGSISTSSGQAFGRCRVLAYQRAIDGSVRGVPYVATTDDVGHYRFFGLPPAKYVIVAMPSTEAGTAGGMPALRHEPRFFPGVSELSRATDVVVTPGSERDGVDLRLEPVITRIVEGSFSPSPSSGYRSSIHLQRISANGILEFPTPILDIDPGKDGSFKFIGVLPGEYVLSVRLDPRSQSEDEPKPVLVGDLRLTVGEADLTRVSLSTTQAPSLVGEVVMADGSRRGALQISGLRIVLGSPPDQSPGGMDPVDGGPMNHDRFARVASDGGFRFDSVIPSRYSIHIEGLPPQWIAVSADVLGMDALDGPVPFDAGALLRPLRIVLTNLQTSLSGFVHGVAKGDSYSVVLLPDSAAARRPGSRRIYVDHLGAAGDFQLSDLVPGDYRIAVVSNLSSDELLNSDLIELLIGASLPVTLKPGEQKFHELRVEKIDSESLLTLLAFELRHR